MNKEEVQDKIKEHQQLAKKYAPWIVPIVLFFIAIEGIRGISTLLESLSTMETGEKVTIVTSIFRTPTHLLFLPVIIRLWMQIIKSNYKISQNIIIVNVVICVAIYFAGGMFIQRNFAQKATDRGYIHCSKKDYSKSYGASKNSGTHNYTIWLPKVKCKQ